MPGTDLLDIGTLLSYHKAEESAELSYMSIMFSVTLALLAFISSRKEFGPSGRILICLVYWGFLYAVLRAVYASMVIHSALHAELKARAMAEPTLFVGQASSPLYKIFDTHYMPHDPTAIWVQGGALGAILVLAVLTVGKGRLFRIPLGKRLDAYFNRITPA